MKNSLPLGNLELIIKKQEPFSTNIIDGCFPFPWLLDFLPYLFKGYRKATDIVNGETADGYPYSKEELAKRVNSTVIPKLEAAGKTENMDQVMKEVYFAFPQLREVVKEIESGLAGFGGGNPGGTSGGDTAMMLPWPLIINIGKIVVAYAVGHITAYLLD